MAYEQYRPTGFRVLPPVVKNLIIINVLMFMGTYAVGYAFDINLVDYLGLHYVQSEKFNPFQFISYMFMHGGFSHIFFNMFALWMFGNVLENVWGGKRFLTYYMVTGIGAALIQTFVTWLGFNGIDRDVSNYLVSPGPDAFVAFVNEHFPLYYNQISGFVSSWNANPADGAMVQNSIQYIHELIQLKMDIPTVGASGAIFGVLLAFGMMFPNSLLYVFFAIPVKAKYFVMAYGALEIYLGIANNPGDNVAHFAHLGGMVFGFFLIKYWNKRIRYR
ncbi:MAG TPA: rhomboid family intramembrane serine protease [Bacteroidales bacterium]|nr:rhomboid family intramembrane serine protease [Bacteroidales bacterium]HNS47880.1 rhomboid family intramembrane serine protease [Bacteroidales bacterium]